MLGKNILRLSNTFVDRVHEVQKTNKLLCEIPAVSIKINFYLRFENVMANIKAKKLDIIISHMRLNREKLNNVNCFSRFPYQIQVDHLAVFVIFD